MGRQGDKETGRQGDGKMVNDPVSLSCYLPVYLIGPRGSGKTTVARLLAERLGRDWIDADEEIERRCGKSIRAIFAEEGEAGFRRHEADVLADLSRRDKMVVATGGGVVLREDNRQRLQTGCVVWLTADVEALFQRIQGDASTVERRPKLTANANARAEIEQVLKVREPLYQSCANFTVDTTTRSPEEIATLILSLLTTDA